MSKERVMAELARIRASAKAENPKAWAHDLRDCELNRGGVLPSGKRMTPAKRTMWRAALRVENTEGAA